jgi:surface protein
MATNDTIKATVRDLLRNNIQALGALDVSQVTDMSDLFCYELLPEGLDLNAWDTSHVTNMSGMFRNCMNIPNISRWNTANVVDMSYMFAGEQGDHGGYIYVNLNQTLGEWNTSKVANMNAMFACCRFTAPIGIGEWDTSSVTTMEDMFAESDFNEDICKWNTTSVTTMSGMFFADSKFNQPINQTNDSWNVSNVTNISAMFHGCAVFNQAIGEWNTKNVTHMSTTFSGCTSFNQDIHKWNTKNVVTMNGMFVRCPIQENFKPLTIAQNKRSADVGVALHNKIYPSADSAPSDPYIRLPREVASRIGEYAAKMGGSRKRKRRTKRRGRKP